MYDANTTKHIIPTQKLLALLQNLSPDAFLHAIEGGLCVISQKTGRMVSIVRFYEEEITVLEEEGAE